MVVRFDAPGATTGLLYLSSGDGTYQAPITLPQAVSPGFTAVGDFNGDGKLDFAAQGASGSQMKIYLGNGNGTFQAAKTVADSSSSGERIEAIVAADVNHDGKTDLVELVAPTIGGNSIMQVWISNGNGTFTAGQRIANVLGGDFGAYAEILMETENPTSRWSTPIRGRPRCRSTMAMARDISVLRSRSRIPTIMTI